MAMESPPVRVEKRSIRVVVAVRLLASIDDGERRRTRRRGVPIPEVERSGRARSCVSRVVSAKRLVAWRRAMDYDGALTPKLKAGT